jgi:hypothetical protein
MSLPYLGALARDSKQTLNLYAANGGFVYSGILKS